MPSKPVLALTIGPTAPRVLYAGAAGGDQSNVGGVFKSTDGGGSWEAIDKNFGTGFGVNALVVDPSTPDVLYAGTTNFSNRTFGAVLMSTNGGGSWAQIYFGPSGVRTLALDTTSPQTLYAGTDGGVFRRVGNAGWMAIDDGFLSTIGAVDALMLDPTVPQTVYAGTSGVGVFISTDGGEHWVPANHGLPANIGAYALALDPSAPHTLHAGTDDGVFTIELPQP